MYIGKQSELGWTGWLAACMVTRVMVILVGVLTFQDWANPISGGKMLMARIILVLIGTSSAMWGLHHSIISDDIRHAMILFRGSLRLQSIAHVVGLGKSTAV